MSAIHRSYLDETLRQREIYLRDGIPPVVMANAIDDARKSRARVFRAFHIRLSRAVGRLAHRSELGRCGCDEVAAA